jgi:hypothetical protein
VVLLSHNKSTDTISLRHYTISLTPSGLTKGIKALVTGQKAPPDLSRFASVADFVEKAGYASDSDVEDAAKVQVQQSGNSTQRSRVRLHEVRPCCAHAVLLAHSCAHVFMQPFHGMWHLSNHVDVVCAFSYIMMQTLSSLCAL